MVIRAGNQLNNGDNVAGLPSSQTCG